MTIHKFQPYTAEQATIKKLILRTTEGQYRAGLSMANRRFDYDDSPWLNRYEACKGEPTEWLEMLPEDRDCMVLIRHAHKLSNHVPPAEDIWTHVAFQSCDEDHHDQWVDKLSGECIEFSNVLAWGELPEVGL